MFDVGGGELILLFIIGLLVLGPQRLPKVAAELGKWAGRARRTATELRRQLEREVELSEVIQPPKPPPAAKPPPMPEPATPPGEQQSTSQENVTTGAAEPVAEAPTSPETADKPPQA